MKKMTNKYLLLMTMPLLVALFASVIDREIGRLIIILTPPMIAIEWYVFFRYGERVE